MTTETKTPLSMSSLVNPGRGIANGKKGWGIDVESVWVPFFTATNVTGDTNLKPEILGSPIVLAENKDGTIKFTKGGQPSTKVRPELTQQIRIVQSNFVASLLNHSGLVAEERPEEYAAEVSLHQKAGVLIKDGEAKRLETQLEAQRLFDEQAAALEQADQTEPDPEAVLAQQDSKPPAEATAPASRSRGAGPLETANITG